MTNRNRATVHFLLLGCTFAVILVPALVKKASVASAAAAEIDHGRELASVYCATCHLEPSPDILPQRSWRAALGYMGYWLGMSNIDYLAGDPLFAQNNVASRKAILVSEGVFPAQPVLGDEDWQAIRHYFLANAPAAPLPQQGKPPLRWQLPRFQIVPSSYHIPQAVTTLVKIRPSRQEIYVGDSISKILTVLDGNGDLKVTARRYTPPVTPIDIEFTDDTAYIASIGDLMAARPSTTKPGSVLAVPLVDGELGNAPATVVLDHLYRLADIETADLNGDGVVDFVVCGFGSVTGAVSWFESQPGGGYAEHPLIALPGAVKAKLFDFDGDGLLDIMVLMANAREGLHVLVNKGSNQFEDHVIFQTDPAQGHTYFELHDFNGDGLMDVLVVNGDNVDSDPYDTPKNYHGVRIYLNRGDLRFEQAYFYPMYGAFIAKAADFDGDGDLDIAAISFYPDYSVEQRESFAYLENDGNLNFSASTSEELNKGRWMTMDVGDIDGDQDIDVVLGGSYVPVGMFAYMDLFEQLARTGPSILILKNTLH
jgi:mono/diheme cytochrome c family protein